MWIQLTSIQQIEVAGAARRFLPGDWVEVGKQFGQLLISQGNAIMPGTSRDTPIMALPGCGMITPEGQLERTRTLVKGIEMIEGKPEVRFERTVIYDPEAPVSSMLFTVGLNLLEQWEMAVPLYDYKMLAAGLGSDEEREETKRVVRDLRAPVYDVRLIFARKGTEAERVIELWNRDVGECGTGNPERKLAFLRALYTVKPLILALPATWTGWNYAR
jgi:hypothetical protein